MSRSVKRKKKSRFKVGGVKIKNAKKKTVDGITFKSSLEAFCYTELKKNGITDFQYEGHKFILQDKYEASIESWEIQSKKSGNRIVQTYALNTPKIRAITYTPDFACINEDTKEGWIIETKGFKMSDFKLKWKIFKKFLTDKNFKVKLYMPNTQENVLKTIKLIKNNI